MARAPGNPMTKLAGLLVLALTAISSPAAAQTIQNNAVASTNGAPLDTTQARVTLTRFVAAIPASIAEIAPNAVPASAAGTVFDLDVSTQIPSGVPGIQAVDITLPAGFGAATVQGVTVGGTTLNAACPTPAAGEFCVTVLGPVVRVTFGAPLVADPLRITVRLSLDTPATFGLYTFGVALTNSSGTLASTAGDADGDASDANSLAVRVTSGQVVQLDKSANRKEASLGEIITYTVTLASRDSLALPSVHVDDLMPIPFRYLAGSATRDGNPLPDPPPGSPMVFDLGPLPGLVDGNGNGVADPGEPGFVTLRYRAVVGSGATPGSYANVAQAFDACPGCAVSNPAEARVAVVTEPVFSTGTVLGRVFEDGDRDGLQGHDEAGVAGARIALDDGTVAVTDREGLYHLAGVSPGHRLVKIDMGSLAGLAEPTGPESRFLTVTSGMLAKANFGVAFQRDTVRVGTPAVPGLAIEGGSTVDTVDVRGNVNDASVLVNGRLVPLRAGDARLTGTGLEERVTLTAGVLLKPVEFHVQLAAPDSVDTWTLTVFDTDGHRVRRLEGRNRPPSTISWNGLTDQGTLVEGGAIYRYQLAVRETGGSRFTSPVRAFGVERRDSVAVTLGADAFDVGRTSLPASVNEPVHRIAQWLRDHPDESVVIEGHTDSVGTAAANRKLSLDRAQAAAAYLVRVEKIPLDRIELRAYGEARPIASNSTPEGRQANRRIEMRGRSMETRGVRVRDYDRVEPAVAVNDSLLRVDPSGRFSRRLDGGPTHWVSVSVTDPYGRVSESHPSLPDVELLEPRGTSRLAFGESRSGMRVLGSGGPGGEGRALASEGEGGGGDVVAVCRLRGRTDPANTVELDGVLLAVAADSTFSAELELHAGSNVFGLVARNPEGVTRLMTIPVSVAATEPNGRTVIAVEPVPNLRAELPPVNARFPDGRYPVSGVTDPTNRVTVNGQAIPVAPDGSFNGAITLPPGRSAVVIEATDSLGRVGRIEREAEVRNDRMFFVAIADGAIGKLEGSGLLRDAVHGGERGLYTEGRVAYYLKGVVRGRFLLTSAYDSGLDEFAPFFDRLDGPTNSRLLTNLDPDRYYPVYGDSSTTLYDAERRGRFYLAVESEELNATVGAAALDLDGGELTGFQRTIEGAHVRYQSLSRTRFGDPVTKVAAIGAEARLTHERDELRGTGGSLYYLSHQDLAEGGEQIALVVRDEKTGLVRLRIPQRRGVDYTMDYPAGRVLFTRPISSVAEAGGIVSHELLAGDPLVIEVEYETRNGEDRSLTGGHVKQQIGPHVGIGGTYVRDDLRSQPYELSGVESELKLSQTSRITGELASSRGAGAGARVSTDGGLSFTDQTPVGALEGDAWRAAVDLDAGEWMKRPGVLRLRGYLKDVDAGFVSSGNLADRGALRSGVGAELKAGRLGDLAFRFDAEKRDSAASDAGRSQLLAVQWRRDVTRWGVGAEFQTRHLENGAGLTLDSSAAVAGRLWSRVTSRLTARLEQQQTVSGPRDDRTTLGLDYQLSSRIGLTAQGTTGSLGNAAEGRAAVSLGAGSFYVTERLSDGPAGGSATTAFGAQAPLGASSRVYSEYQWQKLSGDDRQVMLVGAEKLVKPVQSLLVTLGGEHGETDGPAGRTRRSALTGGAAFTRSGTRLETRNELRLDDGAADRIQVLTSNQAEARLFGGLTLLGRWRWSETRDRNTDRVEARLEEHGFGLALRPSGNGPSALARFTRVGDARPADVLGQTLPTSRMDVFSVEGTTALGRRLEWTGKGATRVITDGPVDSAQAHTHSLLVVNRLNAVIGGPFGIGIEHRMLTQQEAGDARTGWLQELTWDAARHVRVGAGFNFAEFSDNEFSRNDSSVKGWFLRLQGRY